MIVVNKEVGKIKLVFFINYSETTYFFRIDITISLLILMISIIFLLSVSLVYKNEKYKKMYSLAEFKKRRYKVAIEALEGSKDIVYWWNVNKSIISIRESIRKYLDIVGKGDVLLPISTWQNYIIKDDLGKYKSKIKEGINSNKNKYYSIEYRILAKDNKLYWIECKGKKTIQKMEIYLFMGHFPILLIGKKKN